MTTINVDVQAALNSYCSLMTTTLPIVYENRMYTPTVLSPYLEVWLLPSETVPLTLGPEGFDFYSGVFQIDCYYPIGDGWGKTKEEVDRICSHFKKGTVITYNSKEIRIRRSYPGPAIIQDDTWYKIPVTIIYECYSNV